MGPCLIRASCRLEPFVPLPFGSYKSGWIREGRWQVMSELDSACVIDSYQCQKFPFLNEVFLECLSRT